MFFKAAFFENKSTYVDTEHYYSMKKYDPWKNL